MHQPERRRARTGRLAALPRQRLFRAAAAAALTLALLGAQHDVARVVPSRYSTVVVAAVLIGAAMVGAAAVRNGVGVLTHGLDPQAMVTIRNLSTWTLAPRGAAVTVRPRLLDAGTDGKLACLVQVRSAATIEPAVVVEALALALEGVGAASD